MFQLKQIMRACPERYEIRIGDQLVGIANLRKGTFSVEVILDGRDPRCIFKEHFTDDMQGQFANDVQRDAYMRQGLGQLLTCLPARLIYDVEEKK